MHSYGTPKLRIPDIYENRDHQLAFGHSRDACACCATDEAMVAAIRRLAAHRIRGLGPAAANLPYFLHLTIAPPFNAAITRGYNLLTGARVKLGKWDEYLAMRTGIVAVNRRYRELLSNDLGAMAALLQGDDWLRGRFGALGTSGRRRWARRRFSHS
ncbi:MAG: hypothetical protein SFV24_26040 [Gemmatimonadales bacterium]|nr:hypothetical protein [Gemmatimonadales bacterium]